MDDDDNIFINNNNSNPIPQHPHLLEFRERAPYDGLIIIVADRNEIIKIKNKEMLTVDLEYEEEEGIFVDSDYNVYTL